MIVLLNPYSSGIHSFSADCLSFGVRRPWDRPPVQFFTFFFWKSKSVFGCGTSIPKLRTSVRKKGFKLYEGVAWVVLRNSHWRLCTPQRTESYIFFRAIASSQRVAYHSIAAGIHIAKLEMRHERFRLQTKEQRRREVTRASDPELLHQNGPEENPEETPIMLLNIRKNASFWVRDRAQERGSLQKTKSLDHCRSVRSARTAS